MKDKIKLLIQLQDCDKKIKIIIDRKNEGPLKIKSLGDELSAYEAKINEECQALELLKQDRKNIEQEIHDLEEKTEKSNIKLSNVKSNKEYKAALKEIEDLKKIQSQAEDRIIEIMELTDELGEKNKINETAQSELQKKFENDKHEIEKEMVKLENQLKNLNKQRGTLHKSVDQDLLKKYLFLIDRKDGQAISSVIMGVCQTCHLGIPPQSFNELIKGNSLLTCPNCNRIIYWGEEKEFLEIKSKR